MVRGQLFSDLSSCRLEWQKSCFRIHSSKTFSSDASLKIASNEVINWN
jgi:hypothetical protein